MSGAELVVEDLVVAYGPIEAVRGISFRVGPGDVVALLGPNGAGKSSTLAAVTGLVDHEGRAEFDGRSIHRSTPERLARRGLILVPEGRRIFSSLSVHENLQVAQAARGRRPAGMSLDEVYDLFPLLRLLHHRQGWSLSGGEQQMLAIGRALVGGPRLLLLDEPSLGLAPTIVATLFDALQHLAETIPLLIVEQNTAAALDVCTRAHVLSEGRIVVSGTGAELRESTDLVESYLGQRR